MSATSLKTDSSYAISKEFRRCFKNTYFEERRQTGVSSEIHFKIQIVVPDKFSEAEK